MCNAAKVVITADEAPIGGERFPLKGSLDDVLGRINVEHVLVARRTLKSDVNMVDGRDEWLEEVMCMRSLEWLN